MSSKIANMSTWSYKDIKKTLTWSCCKTFSCFSLFFFITSRKKWLGKKLFWKISKNSLTPFRHVALLKSIKKDSFLQILWYFSEQWSVENLWVAVCFCLFENTPLARKRNQHLQIPEMWEIYLIQKSHFIHFLVLHPTD